MWMKRALTGTAALLLCAALAGSACLPAFAEETVTVTGGTAEYANADEAAAALATRERELLALYGSVTNAGNSVYTVHTERDGTVIRWEVTMPKGADRGETSLVVITKPEKELESSAVYGVAVRNILNSAYFTGAIRKELAGMGYVFAAEGAWPGTEEARAGVTVPAGLRFDKSRGVTAVAELRDGSSVAVSGTGLREGAGEVYFSPADNALEYGFVTDGSGERRFYSTVHVPGAGLYLGVLVTNRALFIDGKTYVFDETGRIENTLDGNRVKDLDPNNYYTDSVEPEYNGKANPYLCTGHRWGEISVTEPTCVQAGYQSRRCKYCGVFQTTVLPTVPHQTEFAAGIPAGCEEPGQAEHWVCSACGKLFTDSEGQEEIQDISLLTLPATGHQWGEPEYAWSEDHSVTATAVCLNNAEHVLTETAQAVLDDEASDPAGDPAVYVYRAEFVNPVFTRQTLTEEIHTEPEPTETPAPTEEPEPTETPGPTEEPEPTETPAPTEEPEPTETPEPTEEPEPTETPEPTEEPEPTETPGPTEEPEPTETPEPTEEPEPTETPEPTEEPEPTETPEPTEEPEPTETPEPTEEPEPTETPEPTEEPESTETPETTEEPEETEEPEPTEPADETGPDPEKPADGEGDA